MSRTAVALAVTALLLAGCTTGAPRNTAGQVTASASVDPFGVRVGDCTGELKEGDVSGLQVLPCDQKHYYEAYAATDLPDGPYPGESDVTKQADKFCNAEFKTFIGLATRDSSYEMFYLYPVQESWATGDREVLCLAGSTKGALTGTLKGSKK